MYVLANSDLNVEFAVKNMKMPMFPTLPQPRSAPLIHHLDLGVEEEGRKNVRRRRRKINEPPEHVELVG